MGRDNHYEDIVSDMINFNPRARVGRDIWCSASTESCTHFNPRARVGRDREGRRIGKRDPISIHAPAWGATKPSVSTIFTPFDFNPRARVGRDMPLSFKSVTAPYFNPRARVGRDRDAVQAERTRRHFNPRARVGRDSFLVPVRCRP